MIDPVVHRPEILRLVARLREAARGPARPHTLIIGARGSGKTTVVASAVQAALGSPRTSRRLTVVWVGQDAVALMAYADLLLLILRRLTGGSDPRHAALRRERDHVGLETAIVAALDGRVLVLVLENLHHLFGAFGRTGAGALRGFVESSGSVLVVATSPRVFRDVTSRDEPWFGNFVTERLDGLSASTGAAVLVSAARDRGGDDVVAFVDSEPGRARIAALAHLAGGSIRFWSLLGTYADASSLDDLAPAVRLVLDRLGGYLTGRIAALPADQQTLVAELARGPGAQSVQELADSAGQDPKVTGTTLRRLTDAHLVTATKVPGTDQRTTWYDIREPLLRLHIQWSDLDSVARVGPASPDPPAVPDLLPLLRRWYADSSLHPPASPLEELVVAARGDRAAYAHLPADLRALVDG